jgi:hypothetical protein
MTSSICDKPATSLFEELDAFVDESIDAMSPRELKSFEKARKKIMAESKRRVSGSDVPCENAPQEIPVLRA